MALPYCLRPPVMPVKFLHNTSLLPTAFIWQPSVDWIHVRVLPFLRAVRLSIFIILTVFSIFESITRIAFELPQIC